MRSGNPDRKREKMLTNRPTDGKITVLVRLVRMPRKGGLRLISLNYRDSRPIYEQVKDAFRRLIISGAMKPNEKLPSVRELASQLTINPNTIQRAYQELESDGYIYSVPGKGSFAGDRREVDRGRIQRLCDQIRDMAEELCFLGCAEAEIHSLVKETYAACAGGVQE